LKSYISSSFFKPLTTTASSPPPKFSSLISSPSSLTESAQSKVSKNQFSPLGILTDKAGNAIAAPLSFELCLENEGYASQIKRADVVGPLFSSTSR
jgi:hypothetical protein